MSLGQVRTSEQAGGPPQVWWVEGRPTEGGRQVVVRDGRDMLPPGFSARSKVHEYGGGAYCVRGDELYFVNDADQGLWMVRTAPGRPPADPVRLTPDDGARYADPDVHPAAGAWLACVRERHLPGGVVNDLVAVDVAVEVDGAVDVDGAVAPGRATPGPPPAPVVLASGHDFYAAPRFSPDGRLLAWLTWDSPDMPWDSTTLWTAPFPADALTELAGRAVAGGPGQSVSQPRWSPDGGLHYVSDRSGWWNLYRHRPQAPDAPLALAPMEADFARPDWVFGQSSYAFLEDGRLVATWHERGAWRLGMVAEGKVAGLDVAFNDVSSVQGAGREVVAVAAGPRQGPALVAGPPEDTGPWRTLRRSRPAELAEEAVSEARPFEFRSSDSRPVYAYFYRPRLAGWEGPPGELPPLVVRCHGGPTAAASPGLSAEVQFWTSRGLAVVDVNYSGSSGYGREYRRRLDGQWGVVDVADCRAAARSLVDAGEVDGRRVAIRGSSAGGFTALGALVADAASGEAGEGAGLWAAGTSLYGVADLESLAATTHKFEVHYLHRLVGPYPENRDLYRRRSPRWRADRIRTPVLVLQGADDPVVPLAQAEALVEALGANGVPHAYRVFAGEQHGFRRAETIAAAFEAELSFYGQVMGFEPAGQVPELPVAGLVPTKGLVKNDAKTVDTKNI